MLIQLITQHPEAIGQIVKRTPIWVWGLLAALLALGASQMFDRQMSLRRAIITPLALLGFSIYGMVSAFGASGQLGAALAAWVMAAGAAMAAMQFTPAAGTPFDTATQTFRVRGSVVPLLLILGIFLTKYVVGVELAMQPGLTREAGFVLPVALLYGAFSGIFAGRALRLLRRERVQGTAQPGFNATLGNQTAAGSLK